jgi:hypothetical protein
VPKLVIKIYAWARDIPGFSIALDGVPTDPDTWGARVPLDPGTHVFVVTVPGRRTWGGYILGTEGRTVVVPITLRGPPMPPAPRLPPPPRRPPSPTELLVRRRTTGIALMTFGTMFAMGGLAATIASYETAVQLGSACPSRRGCDPSLVGNYRTDGGLAVAMFVTGGALMVPGIAVLVTSPKVPTSPTRPSIEPRIGVGHLGLAGSF